MGKQLFVMVSGISIGRTLWLLVSCLLINAWASDSSSVSLDGLHAKGVEAYLENDWNGCVELFTAAAEEYRNYVKRTAACRTHCKLKSNNMPHLHPLDTENLYFYETAIKTTLCLLKCKTRIFENKFITLSAGLDKLYGRMKPYEYLHLCYYQMKMPQKAASASFTALVANPENEVMADNLKFYTELPEVVSSEIVNMESKEFVSLYIHGVKAYDSEDFDSAVKYFEESLEKWLNADEECRVYCESPFDQGWLPDFTSSIANHFTYCLRCKKRCELLLSSLNGEYHNDILPSHYNYLQYSYYKVNNLKKACEAVESYLLFYPDDEIMDTNKNFYKAYLDKDSDLFHPREEAYKYVQRQKYEDKLLKYVDTEFKNFSEDDDKDTQDFIKRFLDKHIVEEMLDLNPNTHTHTETKSSRDEL